MVDETAGLFYQVLRMTDPQASLPPNEEKSPSATEFARQAAEAQVGLVAEFVDFLRYNKAWWLTPIIIVLLLFGLAFVLSPAAAPFIYTLF